MTTSPSLAPLDAFINACLERVKALFVKFTLFFFLGLAAAAAIFVFTTLIAVAMLYFLQRDRVMGLMNNPMALLETLASPDFSRFLLGIQAINLFLLLRTMGLFHQAMTHLSSDPSLGVGAALKLGGKRSFGYMFSNGLGSSAVFLGSLLLILPGLWLMTLFFGSAHAFSRGNFGVFGSLKESVRLQKGQFLPLLGRLLLVSCIASFIGIFPPLGLALWFGALAVLYEQLGGADALKAAPTQERRAEPREQLSPFGALDRPAEPAPATAVDAPKPKGKALLWILAVALLLILGLGGGVYWLAKSGKISLKIPGLKPKKELPHNFDKPPSGWEAVWYTDAEKLVAFEGDAAGNFWALDEDGAALIKLVNGKVAGVFKDEAGRMSRPKDLAVDERGHIWVACGQQVQRMDQDGKDLGIVGENVLLEFDAAGQILSALPGPGPAVAAVASDHAGSLWVFDGLKLHKLGFDGAKLLEIGIEGYQGHNPFYPFGLAATATQLHVGDIGGRLLRVFDAQSGTQTAAVSLSETGKPFMPLSLFALPGGGFYVENGASFEMLHLNADYTLHETLDRGGWVGEVGPSMNGPGTVFVDAAGVIYLSEPHYGRVAWKRGPGN